VLLLLCHNLNHDTTVFEAFTVFSTDHSSYYVACLIYCNESTNNILIYLLFISVYLYPPFVSFCRRIMPAVRRGKNQPKQYSL